MAFEKCSTIALSLTGLPSMKNPTPCCLLRIESLWCESLLGVACTNEGIQRSCSHLIQHKGT